MLRVAHEGICMLGRSQAVCLGVLLSVGNVFGQGTTAPEAPWSTTAADNPPSSPVPLHPPPCAQTVWSAALPSIPLPIKRRPPKVSSSVPPVPPGGTPFGPIISVGAIGTESDTLHTTPRPPGYLPAVADPVAPPPPHSLEPNCYQVPSRCTPSICDNPCFWVSSEALIGWIGGSRLPPIFSTSPPDAAQATAGILGSPGTTVTFGGDPVNGGARFGGRFSAGVWLDVFGVPLGLQGSFLSLGSRSTGATISSPDGSLVLARPFVNETGALDAELISFPGLLAGSATAAAHSSRLEGWDPMLRVPLLCSADDYRDGCWEPSLGVRCDGLAGYRYFRFGEDLAISEALTPIDPAFVPGSHIDVNDVFRTYNTFAGAVLGLAPQVRGDKWTIDLIGKADLGRVTRTVTIDGNTTVTVPGTATVTNVGGLLTQTSNIGQYRASQFTVIPELDARLGYDLTPHLRVYSGYSFLLLTKVVRLGDVVDVTVDRNLIPPVLGPTPGATHPAFTDGHGNLWVQGVTLGLEYHY